MRVAQMAHRWVAERADLWADWRAASRVDRRGGWTVVGSAAK